MNYDGAGTTPAWKYQTMHMTSFSNVKIHNSIPTH